MKLSGILPAITVFSAIVNIVAVCAVSARAENHKRGLDFIGLALSLCFVALFYVIRAPEAGLFYALQCYALNAFAAAIAVRDCREKIIPNKWLVYMAGAWVLTATPRVLTDFGAAPGLLARSGFGALLGGGLFLAAFALSRGGLGAGDVKLMAVIGLYLGLRGVMPAVFFSAASAAIAGIGLAIAKKDGEAAWKATRLPLGPFLWFGACLSMLLGRV